MTDLENTQQPESYKVLLIGDNCTDRYVIGEVERLSQEAPVPIIKIVDEYSIPGMSSNVKLNLTRLGIDVDFITSRVDIIKTRYIDNRSKQHLLRVDNEPLVESWNMQTFFNISEYDAIVVSDYDKGFLTYESIEYLIRSTTKTVLIDTKKKDLSRFSAENAIVKINEHEYNSRFSIPKNLIVTLGQKGAMLKQFDKETFFETRKVEIADVCGAGDTFLAALTAKFLETKSIESAIQFANKASLITVQHRGNYAPSHSEILLNA